MIALVVREERSLMKSITNCQQPEGEKRPMSERVHDKQVAESERVQ